jgi:hypothetical protein
LGSKVILMQNGEKIKDVSIRREKLRKKKKKKGEK